LSEKYCPKINLSEKIVRKQLSENKFVRKNCPKINLSEKLSEKNLSEKNVRKSLSEAMCPNRFGREMSEKNVTPRNQKKKLRFEFLQGARCESLGATKMITSSL
jgi:hypothetical protein